MKDLDCKNAKAREKAYKLSDSYGLYLHVLPTGMRVWRWNYRFGGVSQTLTLGRYPELTLGQARLERAAFDKIRRSGIDPRQGRQQVKNAHADADAATFEAVARRWHAQRQHTLSPTHFRKLMAGLEREVFPHIGHLPVNAIKASMIMAALKPIEARGAVERAHRALQFITAIFDFAIALDLAEHNPATKLKGALKAKTNGHQPALRTIEDARALLLAAEAEPGHPLTKLASRLLAVTAVRSASLRQAEPHEFELDTDAPVWRIPASKMKLSVSQKQSEAFEFLVPLPPRAVEIVKLALQVRRDHLQAPKIAAKHHAGCINLLLSR